MEKNSIKKILISNKIIEKSNIIPYLDRVRDTDDISVLKCKKTGIFFLSKTSHMDITKYQNKKKFRYFQKNNNRQQAVEHSYEDTERRFKLLKNTINNKKWLDIGTGAGAILDRFKDYSSECSAVEPNKIMRKKLKKMGYKVYGSPRQAKKNYYEVITLFQVFEHMVHPIKELKLIKTLMKKDSKIIIEVPHASDFLIKTLNLDEFKKFTFWSEHLILHVNKSLASFLELAGFEVEKVFGIQRYSLTNHLHWIFKKRPKGHILWNFMRLGVLEKVYDKFLSTIDQNDTLMVFARKK